MLDKITAKPMKKQAPKFVQKSPETVDVTEGEAITLEVALIGNPQPTVIWTKSDRPITADTPGYQLESDEGTHRLIISHATPKMAAIYSVRAESTAGVTSCRTRLRVKRESCSSIIAVVLKLETIKKFIPVFLLSNYPAAEKPVITQPLKDIKAPIGGNVTLTVKVKGYPTPEVTWMLNGQPA